MMAGEIPGYSYPIPGVFRPLDINFSLYLQAIVRNSGQSAKNEGMARLRSPQVLRSKQVGGKHDQ